MRRQHHELPPSINLADIKDTNSITQIREYQLITPLFGGGVEAGENDIITPIRGTAIRGGLRFSVASLSGRQSQSLQDNLRKCRRQKRGSGARQRSPRRRAISQSRTSSEIQVEIIRSGEAKEPFRIVTDENKRDRNDVPKRTFPKENSITNIHSYAAFPLQPQEKETQGQRGSSNEKGTG